MARNTSRGKHFSPLPAITWKREDQSLRGLLVLPGFSSPFVFGDKLAESPTVKGPECWPSGIKEGRIFCSSKEGDPYLRWGRHWGGGEQSEPRKGKAVSSWGWAATGGPIWDPLMWHLGEREAFCRGPSLQPATTSHDTNALKYKEKCPELQSCLRTVANPGSGKWPSRVGF